MRAPAPLVSTVGVWLASGRCSGARGASAASSTLAAVRRKRVTGAALTGSACSLRYARQAQPVRPRTALPASARIGGVADQGHQHVVERVGIALEIDLVERGIELQGELLIPEHAGLERAAGADHAHGVEPLRARQRAAGAVLDGAQEVDAAADVVDHLAEL